MLMYLARNSHPNIVYAVHQYVLFTHILNTLVSLVLRESYVIYKDQKKSELVLILH